MSTLSRSTALALVASILFVNIAPAMMLPPPLLRSACGVVADAEEVVGNKAMAAGKVVFDMAMKPIAIVGGLKAAAVGTGMKVSGGAIKFVGSKMVKDGAMMEAAGAGVKGAGLGVAALSLKPAAEKIVAAGQVAEGSLNAASAAASNLAKSVGDTSVAFDATIDSPILGHHHKEVNVTAGLNTALRHSSLNSIEQQQQQEVSQQQVEQVSADSTKQQQQEHAVSKRAAKIDTEVMKSALNLVKEAKMEDCVARAICDLNCNPQGFGQDGKQVFMNMVRLQGSNVLDQSDSAYFKEAAAKGRQSSGRCDSCTSHYTKCTSKSSDLIKMASHIRMD